MLCPECSQPLEARSTWCVCGWEKEPKSEFKTSKWRYCAWETNGSRCQIVATIFQSNDGRGPGYCLWHRWCLGTPRITDMELEFRKFIEWLKKPAPSGKPRYERSFWTQTDVGFLWDMVLGKAGFAEVERFYQQMEIPIRVHR